MATMVKSMALEGIEGFPVEIEAATIRGQQQMGLHHRPGRPGGKGSRRADPGRHNLLRL